MIKLKEVLTEARELNPKVISVIAKLTDRNNHNEARLQLAKQMKLRILIKGYEALIILHTIFNLLLTNINCNIKSQIVKLKKYF